MSDSEAVRNVHPIRTPKTEALEAQEAAKQTKAAEKAAEKAAKRAKKAADPEKVEVTIPEFKKPQEALEAVLKAHASVERAEAKKASLGKELGDEIKSRNAALANAAENLEGRSQLHQLLKDQFSALESAKEKASGARSAAKAKREAIAKALEEVTGDSAADLRKLRSAWKAVEKAKEEAVEARANAKKSFGSASEKLRLNVAGARQLQLSL